MTSSCSSGAAACGAGPCADRLSAARVALLATCCAASVANVYYAQPLLDAIARDFAVPAAAIGAVVTATQLGCALGKR